MDFSGLEAQVFIGVAVILGCAFVALLCDYLKGVNERLRERSLELTVRLEESERWRHHAAATAAQAAPAPAMAGESSVGVMSELARLHQEVARVSMSVASIAELHAAVRPEESAVQEPAVFEPARETVASFSYAAPAETERAETERAETWASEVRAPEPSSAKVSAAELKEMAAELNEMAIESGAARVEPEPVEFHPVSMSPVAVDHAPADHVALQPEAPPALQPAAASTPPSPRAASGDAPIIIKPEITPALANLLRVPPRQTPASSLQELMVNVALERPAPRADLRPEARIETRPETRIETRAERGPDIDVDVTEPARPNAVKIRVVRNDAAPALEHIAFEPPASPVVANPVLAGVAPAKPVQADREVEPANTFHPDPLALVDPVPASDHGPVPSGDSPGEMSLPSGMHDKATLDFLRADPTPFTGLVIAIGINDYSQLRESAGAEAADDLLRSVGQLVKSITSNLSGAQHFAARAAEDEFVIVFSGEIGPSAQRRMAAVSERLWDFQLRSIGTFSVVFSWGAAEANEEAFAEAIENASERMRETRQNRKSMGGEKSRKRVVA